MAQYQTLRVRLISGCAVGTEENILTVLVVFHAAHAVFPALGGIPGPDRVIARLITRAARHGHGQGNQRQK